MLYALTNLYSCEWTGTKPHIQFKNGIDYLSTDAIFNKDTTLKIGVFAEKAEEEDVLKSFTFTKSINGIDSTIISIKLSGNDANNYTYDYPFKLGEFVGSKSGDVEKYTATVVNRDGLVNQVSLSVKIK